MTKTMMMMTKMTKVKILVKKSITLLNNKVMEV